VIPLVGLTGNLNAWGRSLKPLAFKWAAAQLLYD
jgi:hypothetical protein